VDLQIWHTTGNRFGQGKELRNKLAAELYKRLNIEHTTTAAYHPQCNTQAEVCNKTIGKYLNSFVDETTLDWEQYLAPMAFSYNTTSLHRSIQNTPYFLTYGQDARLPSFPNPDIQRCFSKTLAGDWYNSLQAARDLATRNNMKATTQAEQDHNRKAELHDYKGGQQIWLHERNFLTKNCKLAPKWAGPYLITKVRDNGNIRIQLDKREINVNVNRIKSFIATNPEAQLPDTSQPQPLQPKPQVATDQKEEEEPWIEVKKKQKPIPKAPEPQIQKQGRGQPRKHMGPPKDKTIQFEPRWTRARAAQMEEEQKWAQRNAIADANIEKLIKTNNIAALIKTDQERWDACLIKLGDAYQMDKYGLPKQQLGVQQPKWVYKLCEYLKSLLVVKSNFIVTGDEAFTFDLVPYTVIYDCFTYADIVRGPAPIQVIESPQVVQHPVQVIAAPVQVIKPPQVVQNPVQAIAAPIQIIEPPQVVQNPVQTIEKPKATVIVPTIVR